MHGSAHLYVYSVAINVAVYMHIIYYRLRAWRSRYNPAVDVPIYRHSVAANVTVYVHGITIDVYVKKNKLRVLYGVAKSLEYGCLYVLASVTLAQP